MGRAVGVGKPLVDWDGIAAFTNDPKPIANNIAVVKAKVVMGLLFFIDDP
jgi:hypothetical protein